MTFAFQLCNKYRTDSAVSIRFHCGIFYSFFCSMLSKYNMKILCNIPQGIILNRKIEFVIFLYNKYD